MLFSCPVANFETILGQRLDPAGRLALWVLKVNEPCKRRMVCSNIKLTALQIGPKVLHKVFHCQQFSSRGAIIPFGLGQRATRIAQYVFLTIN